jgi:hypothetical protein
MIGYCDFIEVVKIKGKKYRTFSCFKDVTFAKLEI